MKTLEQKLKERAAMKPVSLDEMQYNGHRFVREVGELLVEWSEIKFMHEVRAAFIYAYEGRRFIEADTGEEYSMEQAYTEYCQEAIFRREQYLENREADIRRNMDSVLNDTNRYGQD